MNKKSKQQEKLYNFIIAKSFQQPVGVRSLMVN